MLSTILYVFAFCLFVLAAVPVAARSFICPLSGGCQRGCILERCLHELTARAIERDKLRLSPREKALSRNRESGVELTRS